MHIAAVLGKSWGKLATEVWPNEHKIKRLWQEAVGPAIAAKTEPTRLFGTKLNVSVTSAAWMNELTFHKADILRKLTEGLGKGVVEDIIFKVGRVEPPKEKPPEQKILLRKLTTRELSEIDRIASEVKDPTIKEALIRAMQRSHIEVNEK
ncbi:hypothetical protein MNBD_DELTA01-1567 [hydrothermal vent metagenome]|uniref:Zn-ribbon-containing, possibly RNA-binding protein and truncated derivatives n=1 Tax=hydrothermal vent metagenome TaxID=652676 RepID=A0A3B0QWB6_9ZZZZ